MGKRKGGSGVHSCLLSQGMKGHLLAQGQDLGVQEKQGGSINFPSCSFEWLGNFPILKNSVSHIVLLKAEKWKATDFRFPP